MEPFALLFAVSINLLQNRGLNIKRVSAKPMSHNTAIKYKCALLDFDGTILKLAVDWTGVRERLSSLFQLYGHVLSEDNYLSSIRGTSLILDEEGTHGSKGFFVSKAFRIITDAEFESLPNSILMPSAKSALEWLRRNGFMISVVSNNDSSCIKTAFEKFGLQQSEIIVGRNSVSVDKPDTEGARKIMDALDVTVEECFIVGDSETDIGLGRSLGMRTFFITDKDCGGMKFSDITCIRKLDEIAGYIQ